MAIVKRIMANTSEIDLGVTYAREFPIDDSFTTGMVWGQLMSVDGGGDSDDFYSSGVGATAILADSTNETKPALGVLVTTSNKDLYAGLNLDNALVMKPFGMDSENMTTPMVKKVRVKIYDSTAPDTDIYNTVTTALTGTVAIGGTTALTGTTTAFTTELAVGDLVEVEGEVREVKTITNDTAVVTSVAFVGTATGKTANLRSDYGRPVYLTTSGDFTKVLPISGWKQEVGTIVSGSHVDIDIKLGATV
jgi:hypothetical protein